jgi:hypothetical protein
VSQRGSATIAALGVVILCAALAASFYGLYYSATVPLVKSVKRLESRGEALKAVDAIIEALETSGEDGVDSRADLESLPAFEGIDYTVEDISSRLNLNFLPAEVFESPAMSVLAGGSAGFATLRGLREQIGASADFEADFGSIVDVAAIGRWFSPYSYANVNTDDPEAVARFYGVITGDANGEASIKAKIENLRKTKKIFDRAGFTLGFGMPAGASPLIGVEPQINPNHAERTVMEAILGTPAYKVDDPTAVCDALGFAADDETLDAKKIKSVLGADPDLRLTAWFGPRTWFWRVALDVGGARYIAVLRRTGPVTGGDVLVLAGFYEEGSSQDE